MAARLQTRLVDFSGFEYHTQGLDTDSRVMRAELAGEWCRIIIVQQL